MRDNSAVHEYQEVLAGQKKNMTFVFKQGADAENKSKVGEIWRYAIDEILKWDPETAVDFLNNKIVEALKLNKTYHAVGLLYRKNEQIDFKEILQYAYPGRIKYDSNASMIERYEKMLKAAKNGKKSNFPKDYFKNSDGINKAIYLIRYASDAYLGAMQPDEKVRFFADADKSKAFINERLLTVPAKLFKTPLDYYHESIKQNSEKEMIYENEILKILIERYEAEAKAS